jgi:hypothetical protein
VDLTHQRKVFEVTNPSTLQRRVPVVPAVESISNHIGKPMSASSSAYAVEIAFTTYGESLHEYNLTLGHPNNYAPTFAPRIFPAPKALDQYQVNYGPILAVASSSEPYGSHALMSAAPNLQEDAAIISRRDSKDSGVSMGLEMTNKDSNDSQVCTGLRGVPCEFTIVANSTKAPQAALSLSETDFARHTPFEWPPTNDRNDHTSRSWDHKTMLQIGNASVGHGHFQN